MVSLRTPSVDILSFSDLESLESPSWDQLIETLSDYVQSGAAISGRVVIEILKKCKFQDPEHSLVHPLTTIMNLATSWARDQYHRGHKSASEEYRSVESYAYRLLRESENSVQPKQTWGKTNWSVHQNTTSRVSRVILSHKWWGPLPDFESMIFAWSDEPTNDDGGLESSLRWASVSTLAQYTLGFNVYVRNPDGKVGILIGYMDLERSPERVKVLVDGEMEYWTDAGTTFDRIEKRQWK